MGGYQVPLRRSKPLSPKHPSQFLGQVFRSGGSADCGGSAGMGRALSSFRRRARDIPGIGSHPPSSSCMTGGAHFRRDGQPCDGANTRSTPLIGIDVKLVGSPLARKAPTQRTLRDLMPQGRLSGSYRQSFHYRRLQRTTSGAV